MSNFNIVTDVCLVGDSLGITTNGSNMNTIMLPDNTGIRPGYHYFYKFGYNYCHIDNKFNTLYFCKDLEPSNLKCEPVLQDMFVIYCIYSYITLINIKDSKYDLWNTFIQTNQTNWDLNIHWDAVSYILKTLKKQEDERENNVENRVL